MGSRQGHYKDKILGLKPEMGWVQEEGMINDLKHSAFTLSMHGKVAATAKTG